MQAMVTGISVCCIVAAVSIPADGIPTPNDLIPTPQNSVPIPAPKGAPRKATACPCSDCRCESGTCPNACVAPVCQPAGVYNYTYKSISGTFLQEDGTVAIYDPRDGGTYRFSREGRESGQYSDALIQQVAEQVKTPATHLRYTRSGYYGDVFRSVQGCPNGQCGK